MIADKEPTEEEIRAVDEIIARSPRLKVVERPEGQTRVIFVGREGLAKVRKALGH